MDQGPTVAARGKDCRNLRRVMDSSTRASRMQDCFCETDVFGGRDEKPESSLSQAEPLQNSACHLNLPFYGLPDG